MSPRSHPAFTLPRDVPRPARTAFAFLALGCDHHYPHEFHGDGRRTALERLGELCGWEDREATRGALVVLEQAKAIRTARSKTLRIFVVSASDPGSTECLTCTEPVAKMRGAQRCPKCIQIQRREWKAEAIALWCKCKALGKSDFGIAWHIAKRLNLPLVTKAEEGVKGSGSGQGEGVIEWMTAEGLCANPVEMAEYARRLRRGEESNE